MLTTIEKILFLNKIELFNTSTPEALVYLARISKETEFNKGTTLLLEGEKADGLYIIVEGKVSLIRNNIEVAELGTDQIIGTWALFDEDPWPYSAAAKTKVITLPILRNEFYDLLDDYPEISQGLFRALSRKIRLLVEQLDDGTQARTGTVKGGSE